MAVELKNCMMVGNTKAIGLKAACMEGDFIRGLMDRNTKDNIPWTKSKDTAVINGRMERGI